MTTSEQFQIRLRVAATILLYAQETGCNRRDAYQRYSEVVKGAKRATAAFDTLRAYERFHERNADAIRTEADTLQREDEEAFLAEPAPTEMPMLTAWNSAVDGDDNGTNLTGYTDANKSPRHPGSLYRNLAALVNGDPRSRVRMQHARSFKTKKKGTVKWGMRDTDRMTQNRDNEDAARKMLCSVDTGTRDGGQVDEETARRVLQSYGWTEKRINKWIRRSQRRRGSDQKPTSQPITQAEVMRRTASEIRVLLIVAMIDRNTEWHQRRESQPWQADRKRRIERRSRELREAWERSRQREYGGRSRADIRNVFA